jgi:hypothetical protein
MFTRKFSERCKPKWRERERKREREAQRLKNCMVFSPFFLSWFVAMRSSEIYWSSMVRGEDDDEEDDKQSMLKLFLIEEEEEEEEGEEDKSSCTPNSLNLPTKSLPFWVAQVLELWPIFPQTEQFLAIIACTNNLNLGANREEERWNQRNNSSLLFCLARGIYI